MRLLLLLVALAMPFRMLAITEQEDYFGRYQAALVQENQAEMAIIRNQMQPNLWPAKENGKWGYINRLGEWVIQPQYDDAYYFVDNATALVCMKGLWGSIDIKGNQVAAPQWRLDYDGFDVDYLTKNWLFTDLEGRWLGFNGKTGRFVTSVAYDHGMANEFGVDSIIGYDSGDDRARIYDVYGNEMLSEYIFNWAFPFDENGLAVVQYQGREDFCRIDRDGKVVEELGKGFDPYAMYDVQDKKSAYSLTDEFLKEFWVGNISDKGFAWISARGDDFLRYVLYDLNQGRIISDEGWYGVESDRHYMFSWRDGVSVARGYDKETYFREDGLLIYPDGFDYCAPFISGLGQARTHDDQMVYVDAFGHYVWQESKE